MKICNGCGGIIGVDCFNPKECEWIAIQQMHKEQVTQAQEQSNYDEIIHNMQQHIDYLEKRIFQLEEITKHLPPI